MKIIVEGTEKEIVALVLEIQDRQAGISTCQTVKAPLTVEGREEYGAYIV